MKAVEPQACRMWPPPTCLDRCATPGYPPKLAATNASSPPATSVSLNRRGPSCHLPARHNEHHLPADSPSHAEGASVTAAPPHSAISASLHMANHSPRCHMAGGRAI
ncbi:hypothetical protein Q8A67_021585 [Cirrhinus molitorella]|uniref:Uncharacterized protein n=1 Tax=Cirrhinus molitorella TaxID=172907 RepID=A0AA88PBT0_9TELE|nr:hypothetical protein Q8A67_021585 [Cirrhinus molitorella]